MSQTVSLEKLARFALLNGADRLINAFSGIPEGPLRESVIHMAETMSATYASAPMHAQAPDPLNSLGGGVITPSAPPPRRQLPGPSRPIKTDDPNVRAVELRIQGKFPHEIAAETGLSMKHVYDVIGDARRAGVKLPYIGRAKKGATPHETPYLTDLSQLTHHAQIGAVNRAAIVRGITPEAYLARRKLALDMALEGRHIRAILEATKESRTALSNWFNVARGAGYAVPYMVDTQYVKPVDAPNVVTLKPKRKSEGGRTVFIIRLDDYNAADAHHRHAIDKGAKMMGLDVDNYLRVRREVIASYSTGTSNADAVDVFGITPKQASNWRTRAAMGGLLHFRNARREGA